MFLCFCIACVSGENNFSRFTEDPSTIQVEDLATVEVHCDVQDVPAGKQPMAVLAKQGVLRGVQDVFNDWLTRRLLFPEYDPGIQVADCSVSKDGDFVHGPIRAKVELEEETDTYAQSFEVQVGLKPWAKFRGEIIDLQEGRSMAGGLDQVLIQGREWIVRAEDAFFVVARPVPEIKGQALRIIGSGQIVHVLGSFAQGKLLETNHEIQVGDRIYPVWVSVRTLGHEEPPDKDTAQHDMHDMQEVVVQPQTLPFKTSWSPPAEPK
jgi:hypothetical protein